MTPDISGVGSGAVVLSWFNRFGGKPTATHPGTGIYEVAFPGLEGRLGNDAIVSATLFLNPGTAVQADASNDDVIRIRTHNSAGSLADRDFDLVVMAPN